MEKRLIPALFFLLIISSSKLCSQNNQSYKFDKITASDFVIQSPLIDSNTNAVIIADIGNTDFEGNDKGWFTYVFKRKTRIKIINKRAIDIASIEIPLYQDEDDREKLSDLSAATYNLINGQVVANKLDKKSVFNERKDKNHSLAKFALPAVSEGSIIEYSYTIKSNFIFNIPSWEFQHPQYPSLWNEYNITIPNLLVYMSLRQGQNNFYIDKTEEGYRTYSVKVKHGEGIMQTEQSLSVSTQVNKHRWVMKDIPGIKIEDYITTPLNYIAKIDFQLYQTNDGEQTHDVFTTWQKAVGEIMKRSDFGKVLEENDDLFGQLAKQIVNVNDDQLKQVKDIYYYIQKNFTCTNYHQFFFKSTLKGLIEKKSGNVGEINLLLTGLLRQLDVYAAPVILSVREAGRAYSKYPQMDQYNYVICKIKLGNEDYYLDASQPLLGFAKLPLNCYNGFAKVISKDSADVYFNANQLKEVRTVLVFISNSSENGYRGSVTKNYGYYESLQTRRIIAQSSEKDYKSNIEKNSIQENIKIENIKIDSLNEPELPLVVKYDLNINTAGNEDIIYFNPLLDEKIMKNPFAAAEREYPVEMPYTTDDTYILNMEVPKGYMIDELPKSARVMLNEKDGMFEYLISANENTIQMKCSLQFNKANFNSDNYQSLREFYGHVVKKEAEQIVFKKIKK
ncbi:hypothetical protein GALL_55200 [mine drainage metagenome]|uniref:Uncharacterized protein n=1 Tax=mine drainage metagenome TaxID=410659 RepID=A0A1J5TA59_9ZZZZ